MKRKAIKKIILISSIGFLISSTNINSNSFCLKNYEIITYKIDEEAKPIYFLNPIDYVTDVATISNNFRYYSKNSYLELINFVNENVSKSDLLDVHLLNDFLDEVSLIYPDFYDNGGLKFDIGSITQINEVYVDGINNKFGYYLFCIYSSDFITYQFDIEYKVNYNTYNFEITFKELNNSFIGVNYFETLEELDIFINEFEVEAW